MNVTREKKQGRGSFLVLIILSAFWLLPTVGLFITSLRAKGEAQTSGWWDVLFNPFSQDWDISSYTTVLTENKLATSFISSMAVTIPATILPLLFAAYAAFGFTFLSFRGREFFFSVIIGLLVVPLQGALVPVLKMFISITDKTGIEISGQYAAAWFVHSAFAMPLAIYILRNYMMTIPNALIEAARVDGASNFTIFWRLVLPISVPALASFAIFQFLWVWNDLLVAIAGVDNFVKVYKDRDAAIATGPEFAAVFEAVAQARQYAGVALGRIDPAPLGQAVTKGQQA